MAARLPQEGFFRANRVRVDRHAVKYLVDANVLSEPTKKMPDSKVVDWLRENAREIVLGATWPYRHKIEMSPGTQSRNDNPGLRGRLLSSPEVEVEYIYGTLSVTLKEHAAFICK